MCIRKMLNGCRVIGRTHSRGNFTKVGVPIRRVSASECRITCFISHLFRCLTLVTLRTNGGFGDADYFFEDYLGVRQSLLDNLHQKPGREFPFFCLNPDLAWSGPFRWWEPKLRPIIKLLIGNNMSYTSALKVLAKKIAVVELFPYHSRNSAKLKGVNEPNLMPSVRKAREFLALESHNDKRLKLLMRRHNDWSSSSCAPESAHFVYGPRKTQSIWLNPGLPGPNGDAGRAIKRKLGIA